MAAWRATAGGGEPCIRCGDCADACPEGLAPARLAARLDADDLDGALERGLMTCTGCGACEAVCPSGLPLAVWFGEARAATVSAREMRAVADAARERHRQRAARLARLAEEADAAQARRIQRIGAAAAAALAKARAKRGGTDA